MQSEDEARALLEWKQDVLKGLETFHWFLEFPEVFTRENGGFDAFVGNPPFVGGLKISSTSGDSYLAYLKQINPHASGTADLSSYFFKLSYQRLRQAGTLGLIATNTIAQGDTRAAALNPISAEGGAIYNAVPSMKWPGAANLEVALVHIHKGAWPGAFRLQDQEVPTITPMLDDGSGAVGEPYRLLANQDLAFQGSIVLGMGFVMTPEEAQALIAKNPKNKDVLFPYLNGEDLNSRPDQSPSRWVINFFDWPLERVSREEWDAASLELRKELQKVGLESPDYEGPVAADYPDCLEIVRENVKNERDELADNPDGRRRKTFWWLYGRITPTLNEAVKGLARVFALPLTSKYLNVAPQQSVNVFSHATGVVASDDWKMFAFLQCTIHEVWARTRGSTLETRLRYTPSDVFETFPLPANEAHSPVSSVAKAYCELRSALCHKHSIGLTDLFNEFHDPVNEDPQIQELRRWHAQLDASVLKAYGWDFSLDHNFYSDDQVFEESLLEGLSKKDRKQKLGEVRFTVSPQARKAILRKLLELNHQRHQEEVEQGLVEVKDGKVKVTAKGKKWLEQQRKRGKPEQAVKPTVQGETGTSQGALFGQDMGPLFAEEG